MPEELEAALQLLMLEAARQRKARKRERVFQATRKRRGTVSDLDGRCAGILTLIPFFALFSCVRMGMLPSQKARSRSLIMICLRLQPLSGLKKIFEA
mgnify:CR=1 FL=1